jgi:hypothetical protein
MSVFLLGLLAFACVVPVAWPLLRPAPAGAVLQPALLEALEERDRALAALRELEFDHRAGKILDDDYRELVRSLRLRAADALSRVEGDA